MRLKKSLIYPFVCMFLAGCYYCPGVWSDSPQTFTFTLDKHEAKRGDEITIDTGKIEAFDAEFYLCCDYYIEKAGISESYTLYIRNVDVINSTKAKFKIPIHFPEVSELSEDGTPIPNEEGIIIGQDSLRIGFRSEFRQKTKREPSCEVGIWYSSGYADKKLKVIK